MSTRQTDKWTVEMSYDNKCFNRRCLMHKVLGAVVLVVSLCWFLFYVFFCSLVGSFTMPWRIPIICLHLFETCSELIRRFVEQFADAVLLMGIIGR